MGPLTVALLTVMQEHPLPALLRAGVPVTINSVRLPSPHLRHRHTSATPPPPPHLRHPAPPPPRTSAIVFPIACRFCRSHLPLTLAQDDPLLFGPRLLDEYETCRAQLGLSDEELAQVLDYIVHAHVHVHAHIVHAHVHVHALDCMLT